MKSASAAIHLPPNPAPYLTDWWQEIGPVSGGGMGEAPIGWQDIAAWERLTGIELEPWEARVIRRMSGAWLNERESARKPGCPPPYSETHEAVRDQVSDQFGAMFKAIANRPKPKNR